MDLFVMRMVKMTLLQTYYHTDIVTSVAWSPDGTSIASASSEDESYGNVYIRQVGSDNLLYVYTGHLAGVTAVSWSPDGKHLASASVDGTVQVWQAPHDGIIPSEPVSVSLRRPVTSVLDVTWSPDGTFIAAACFDRKVYVWNVERNRRLSVYQAGRDEAFHVYESHLSVVSALAWSPDGKQVASLGYESQPDLHGTVHLWQIPQEACEQAPMILSKPHITLFQVTWSPDSKYIAATTGEGMVEIWERSTAQNVFTHYDWAGLDAGSTPLRLLAWSPDGTRLASGYGRTGVQVWDAFTGNNQVVYEGHSDEILEVAWSPDGTRLASASVDKTVQIWDEL